jgi:hypothetical protein
MVILTYSLLGLLMYMLSPRRGFDRVALLGRPRSGSASGVVEDFAREADPHLGQNISTRDAESLLTASRSLNSYYALEADPLLGR